MFLAAAACTAALACGLTFGAEAASASAPRVAVLGSAAKVRPTDALEGADRARLIGARNEFESFQVAVQAGAGVPVRDLRIELAAAPHNGSFRFPASSVLIYREGYYRVRKPTPKHGAPGRWPDALIPTVDPLYREPRRAFPVDVPAGENRVAWVDVLVPPKAPPGTYVGAIEVRARGLTRTVPIRLRVLPLRLRSTASIDSAFGFWNERPTCLLLYGARCDAGVEPYFQQAELFIRLALDNRTTLVGYQVATDRSLARRYVLPYLQGRGKTRLRGARLTAYQAGTGALPEWRQMAEDWGYVDRSFIQLCDEPGTDAARWEECRQRADELKPQWPAAHTLITASYAHARDAGALSLFDTMVTLIEELGPPPRSTPKQRFWIYTSCSSWGCGGDDPAVHDDAGYAIDEPASEGRAVGWLAFLYRATGELLWRADSQVHTAWGDQYAQGGNGDGTLFYIGTPDRIGGTRPVPLESLRLKLIRDGHEDYEYLRFLAEHGKAAEARGIARKLFPAPSRTKRSDAEVQEARRQLAGLVAAVRAGG